jgi:hypothetical protein
MDHLEKVVEHCELMCYNNKVFFSLFASPSFLTLTLICYVEQETEENLQGIKAAWSWDHIVKPHNCVQ